MVRSRSAVQTFEVLAVDASARRWPWHYLVTTWCSGQLWSEVRPRKKSDEVRALYTALGEAIGQLHTIGFSTCGEITSNGKILADTSSAAALRRRAQRRIANPGHVALFFSVLQEHRSLFETLPAGVLCHEDLNPTNLLVQEVPGSPPTLAVIDFDSAWAGCAESDLARLEFWRGMTGEGFWEAYRVHAPLSDSYPQRRPIYQLLWCLEYARPTVQHLRDTASVCEALRLPPVTFP
jgi:aminoglycoside phosphotransferase (APT) family kinase protein